MSMLEISTNHCLGHVEYVQKCHSREQVRDASKNVLKRNEENPDIQSSFTNTTTRKEKSSGIFKQEKVVYDLTVTYFHKDNCPTCNNYKTEVQPLSEKEVEIIDKEPSLQDSWVRERSSRTQSFSNSYFSQE